MENNSEIRPFTIDIPHADLDDLRDRLARTPGGLRTCLMSAGAAGCR
jgi:hypothetical protein